MKKISIIVPCFNEQEMIDLLLEQLKCTAQKLDGYNFEFLLVDDGSRDQTLQKIKEAADKDPQVVFVSFSRNFGKEAAIYAGLKHCSGDLAVVMDADLQDPPDLLLEMVQAIEEGYDSAAARRVSRKGEPAVRSMFARMFYKIMNRASDVEMMDGARDYRLMTRPFVDAVLELAEYNRFTKGIYGWVGFSTKWIEYENIERAAGETKWSFWKLFKYALSGMISFSAVPLQFASAFGILFSLIAFIMIVVIVIRTLLFGDPVSGWPSMICVIMLIGGIQLLSIGILGQYLSRTYLEVKHRPVYICKETNLQIRQEEAAADRRKHNETADMECERLQSRGEKGTRTDS